MTTERPSLSELVGRNTRRLRERHAKTLGDVSHAARALGLNWEPSGVSRIERGKRALTVDEFIVLPRVMTSALGRPVTLVDLTALDRTAADAEGSYLETLALLGEPLIQAPYADLYDPDVDIRDGISGYVAECLSAEVREPTDSTAELLGIAAELGVMPDEAAAAFELLWGTTSFRAERERRLAESGHADDGPAVVRTVRGHLRRQMIGELRGYLAARQEAGDGQR